MKEILPPSTWEIEYWETHNNNLGLPQGTIFDSQSFVKWEARQRPVESSGPKK
jgi:hypothetical protein